jgi:hypothetical protein
VDTVHIDIVTAPGQLLTVGANQQAREIVDGPGRTMVAGNPLRIFKGQWTGAHWYFQTSMQQAARRIAEIHMQHDRAGRRLRSATPPRQKKQVDACDEAQDTSLHLLIISQQVIETRHPLARKPRNKHDGLVSEGGFPMANTTPQSYANHARLDPPFHFFLAPLLIVAIILSIISLVRHPGLDSILWLLLAVALFLTAERARSYALKAQDRVIRLEERLRLSMLLPEAARPRIAELTEPQLIALRFASDAELPGLAMRAVNEGLTNKQIKTSIQSWRADTFRV